MKLCALLSVTLASCAWAAETPRNDGANWTTLHGDLQRSGFYPQFPNGPLRMAWRKELWRELTGPRAEVIVGGGLAFMGTYSENPCSWDADTGTCNFGWENRDGYEFAKAAGQPYGLVNEWPGPARAIVSVAGNSVHFPVGSQVIGLEGAR